MAGGSSLARALWAALAAQRGWVGAAGASSPGGWEGPVARGGHPLLLQSQNRRGSLVRPCGSSDSHDGAQRRSVGSCHEARCGRSSAFKIINGNRHLQLV